MKASISSLAAGASLLAGAYAALPPVHVEGNAFWTKDGDRFYVRGVAYQPGGAADAKDPMADMDAFKRDVKHFEELGINTIRIYTIDNSIDHDDAMKLLDDAGIYLTLDANSPAYSLNRENIASLHASYNDVYLQNVFATIDAFKKYDNLLMFFSANEVINAKNNTNAAPYIKAVTRDMRQYISAKADRQIPVGYSSADVAENIENQALYFACGEDKWARSDFFAFNDYSWCEPSTFERSGWDKKTETYSNYSLPIFLSEFGCITNKRTWGELEALYSEPMASVYSGGLAYEYTLEDNGYGLVEMKNGQVVPNGDFDRLVDAYKEYPSPRGDAGANKNTTVPQCPSQTDDWDVNPSVLPKMPKGAEKFMRDGAGKPVGIDGDGSQWAGKPSETEPDLSNGSSSYDSPDGVASAPNSDGSTAGSSAASSSEGAAPTVAGMRVAVAGVAATLLFGAVSLL